MIPFNRPTLSSREIEYIQNAISLGQLSGDGYYTKQCEDLIKNQLGVTSAHLTHSCTAGLEMAAILANLDVGDEVIMPSYTFVSTANAFALRGATPVFVDVRSDTLNMCPEAVANAVTDKTKAIVPVHYAGVVCDMQGIDKAIAGRDDIRVIEDAAQALGSSRWGIPAGKFGDMAAFSFHETKNIISGEGGCLVTNDLDLEIRAYIIREKGTNRRAFFEGFVDKYSWVDIGSSFLPGELIAAFLYAQLESASRINQDRVDTWNKYHTAFETLETSGHVRRPFIPAECEHNGHMYYLILNDAEDRKSFIGHMRSNEITTPFHYIPLHTSPYGQKISRAHGTMENTDELSKRLVRLPLFPKMTDETDKFIEVTLDYFAGR